MEIRSPSAIAMAEDCHTGPSPPEITMSEKPVKKPTRQWAAWTRQEEENFFCALRQVGKNFEKITCRVQSKNKDQVRHYYYRLVRRMNKLLGPGFGLDAKNSKDTIAAMLRWWSLLEKYSCTASKLHLKPRRFKTFIEALAHQLLKDRNKNRRRRLPHGEIFSSIPENTASVLRNEHTNESHSETAFLINGQLTQKVGSTKGGSLKNQAANETYNKAVSFTDKIVKPRRKTSLVASAAFKRWEKAAMAGVSLVADAAEQLEQSNKGVNDAFDLVTSSNLFHGDNAVNSSDNVSLAGHAKQTVCKNVNEVCLYQSRDAPHVTKLKLQLFPVDECTRKALEKDGHNPYLELTLSNRKKISSILDHLSRKWGSSSIASGELTLFPYNIHPDLANCLQWTYKDKSASSGDIYLAIGSPAIFRLRYGWFANGGSGSELCKVPAFINNDHMLSSDDLEVMSVRKSCSEDVLEGESCPQGGSPLVETVSTPSACYAHEHAVVDVSHKYENKLKEPLQNTNVEDSAARTQNGENARLNNGTSLADEWADNLTNISVGDLLTEASRAAASVCTGLVDAPTDPMSQQGPFSCDSFDAIIAAHVSGFKEESPAAQCIWNAEETCDEFSFCMTPSGGRVDISCGSSGGGICKSNYCADAVGFHGLLKKTEALPSSGYSAAKREENSELTSDKACDVDKSDSENALGVSDIYWPDSLGALDLETPPRYVSDEMLFGESISLGLSRLMASSLDAFQNCSFFSISLDKREPSK